MKEKLSKKIIKKIIKKYFLEDLRMSLLNLNFIMIYIIHEMLVMFKNHLNCIKDSTFDCFLRGIIDFYS